MAPRLPSSGYVLGLDVGEKRIGTAIASSIARLPQPIEAIAGGEQSFEQIIRLAERNEVRLFVVGLPRNLEGAETPQSAAIRQFADGLASKTTIPIVFADESLSSVRADSLSKSNQFPNASRDSLAACFILDEFFATIEA